jgi:hypothetical protein
MYLSNLVYRLSNDVVQSTAAQEREEKKLHTYSELSSTLSKISPSAADAVAPALAEITSNHFKAKERVERECMLLGHLWEDVFDIFVSGITSVVDSSLRDALDVLKRQGEETAQTLALTAVSASKRKTSSSPGENGEPGGTGVSASLEESQAARSSHRDGRSHDTKRRRLTGPTSGHLHAQEETGATVTSTTADSNLQGILRELMLKMESQSQSLATLTEENAQVGSPRNLLAYRLTIPPSA